MNQRAAKRSFKKVNLFLRSRNLAATRRLVFQSLDFAIRLWKPAEKIHAPPEDF